MEPSITPNDLRVATALGELRSSVDNIGQLLAHMRSDFLHRVSSVEEAAAKHSVATDARLTLLEGWRYKVLGAAAAISVAASFVLQHIL